MLLTFLLSYKYLHSKRIELSDIFMYEENLKYEKGVIDKEFVYNKILYNIKNILLLSNFTYDKSYYYNFLECKM